MYFDSHNLLQTCENAIIVFWGCFLFFLLSTFPPLKMNFITSNVLEYTTITNALCLQQRAGMKGGKKRTHLKIS